MISPKQIRAARAMLDWSTADLALLTGLTPNALNKIEREHVVPQMATLQKIQKIFERYGVEFIAGSGLKKKENIITVLEGDGANRELAKDVYETLKDTGGEFLIAYSDEEAATRSLGQGFLDEQIKRRISANISHRLLCCKKDVDMIKDIPSVTYRVLPEEQFSPCPFFTYGSKIALLSLEGKEKAIIIDDDRFAQSVRCLFNFVWELASGNYQKGTIY